MRVLTGVLAALLAVFVAAATAASAGAGIAEPEAESTYYVGRGTNNAQVSIRVADGSAQDIFFAQRFRCRPGGPTRLASAFNSTALGPNGYFRSADRLGGISRMIRGRAGADAATGQARFRLRPLPGSRAQRKGVRRCKLESEWELQVVALERWERFNKRIKITPA